MIDDITKEIKAAEDRVNQYYHVAVDWIDKIQRGGSVGREMLKRGYKSIALYGYGDLGRLLCTEARLNQIEVKYVVDRNPYYKTLPCEVKIIQQDEQMETVDVMIVTALNYYLEIKKTLLEKGFQSPVISIEELIYS